jgi:ABC-2 type transport system ATP-binding protein/lipopolysaccharide transport system ATP-binding protein
MDVDSSGYDNIILRGKYLGIGRTEIEDRVDEIAEFSELGDFLNMPIRTYSAGMTARLAFAISTAVQADILLIDEGVGAGDAAFVTKANARLENLIDNSPIAIFASHDESAMRKFCTRGIVLQSGRLQFDGAIDAAYRYYGELIGAAVA